MDTFKPDELTSTMGNVLSTSNKEEKSDSSDATPTSSTDANTNPTASCTVSEDPISSTSSDNFDQKSPTMDKNFVGLAKVQSADNVNELLEMPVSNEKITEDVEDLVHDLESLLGETSQPFIIPVNEKEADDNHSPKEAVEKDKDVKDIVNTKEPEDNSVVHTPTGCDIEKEVAESKSCDQSEEQTTTTEIVSQLVVSDNEEKTDGGEDIPVNSDDTKDSVPVDIVDAENVRNIEISTIEETVANSENTSVDNESDADKVNERNELVNEDSTSSWELVDRSEVIELESSVSSTPSENIEDSAKVVNDSQNVTEDITSSEDKAGTSLLNQESDENREAESLQIEATEQVDEKGVLFVAEHTGKAEGVDDVTSIDQDDKETDSDSSKVKLSENTCEIESKDSEETSCEAEAIPSETDECQKITDKTSVIEETKNVESPMEITSSEVCTQPEEIQEDKLSNEEEESSNLEAVGSSDSPKNSGDSNKSDNNLDIPKEESSSESENSVCDNLVKDVESTQEHDDVDTSENTKPVVEAEVKPELVATKDANLAVQNIANSEHTDETDISKLTPNSDIESVLGSVETKENQTNIRLSASSEVIVESVSIDNSEQVITKDCGDQQSSVKADSPKEITEKVTESKVTGMNVLHGSEFTEQLNTVDAKDIGENESGNNSELIEEKPEVELKVKPIFEVSEVDSVENSTELPSKSTHIVEPMETESEEVPKETLLDTTGSVENKESEPMETDQEDKETNKSDQGSLETDQEDKEITKSDPKNLETDLENKENTESDQKNIESDQEDEETTKPDQENLKTDLENIETTKSDQQNLETDLEDRETTKSDLENIETDQEDKETNKSDQEILGTDLEDKETTKSDQENLETDLEDKETTTTDQENLETDHEDKETTKSDQENLETDQEDKITTKSDQENLETDQEDKETTKSDQDNPETKTDVEGLQSDHIDQTDSEMPKSIIQNLVLQPGTARQDDVLSTTDVTAFEITKNDFKVVSLSDDKVQTESVEINSKTISTDIEVTEDISEEQAYSQPITTDVEEMEAIESEQGMSEPVKTDAEGTKAVEKEHGSPEPISTDVEVTEAVEKGQESSGQITTDVEITEPIEKELECSEPPITSDLTEVEENPDETKIKQVAIGVADSEGVTNMEAEFNKTEVNEGDGVNSHVEVTGQDKTDVEELKTYSNESEQVEADAEDATIDAKEDDNMNSELKKDEQVTSDAEEKEDISTDIKEADKIVNTPEVDEASVEDTEEIKTDIKEADEVMETERDKIINTTEVGKANVEDTEEIKIDIKEAEEIMETEADTIINTTEVGEANIEDTEEIKTNIKEAEEVIETETDIINTTEVGEVNVENTEEVETDIKERDEVMETELVTADVEGEITKSDTNETEEVKCDLEEMVQIKSDTEVNESTKSDTENIELIKSDTVLSENRNSVIEETKPVHSPEHCDIGKADVKDRDKEHSESDNIDQRITNNVKPDQENFEPAHLSTEHTELKLDDTNELGTVETTQAESEKPDLEDQATINVNQVDFESVKSDTAEQDEDAVDESQPSKDATETIEPSQDESKQMDQDSNPVSVTSEDLETSVEPEKLVEAAANDANQNSDEMEVDSQSDLIDKNTDITVNDTQAVTSDEKSVKESEAVVESNFKDEEDEPTPATTTENEVEEYDKASIKEVSHNEVPKQNKEKPKGADKPKKHRKSERSDTFEELSINVDVSDREKTYSPKVTIKPIKVPDEEVSTTTSVTADSEISKGSLKMTITKQSDNTHSILKISDQENSEVVVEPEEEPIPKLIIKPKMQQVEPQHSPKMSTRSSKHSPTSSTQSSVSPRITIKPVVKQQEQPVSPLKIKINTKANSKVTGKDEDGNRKGSVKPAVKSNEESEQVQSPRITIKPIPKPDIEKETSPRLTIKPIKKPDEEVGNEEKERTSPKITIKPIIKPQDSEPSSPQEEEEVKERIVLKINKGNLPSSPIKESKKREHSVDEDKSERLAKITVKISKEGGHHIVQQPGDDSSLKRAQEESPVPEKNKKQKVDADSVPEKSKKQKLDVDSVISTRSTRHKEHHEGTEPKSNPESEKRASQRDQSLECPIETKKPKKENLNDKSKHKENDHSDEIQVVEPKLDSPITISEDSRSQDSGSVILLDENKDDSMSSIDTVKPNEVNAKSILKATLVTGKSNTPSPVLRKRGRPRKTLSPPREKVPETTAVETVSGSESVTASPVIKKAKGRPRKIPLEPREEFKNPEDSPKPKEPEKVQQPVESGRPKRSCRGGQSVCDTLGIKPRKSRGSARGRGSTRGIGNRSLTERCSSFTESPKEDENVSSSDKKTSKFTENPSDKAGPSDKSKSAKPGILSPTREVIVVLDEALSDKKLTVKETVNVIRKSTEKPVESEVIEIESGDSQLSEKESEKLKCVKENPKIKPEEPVQFMEVDSVETETNFEKKIPVHKEDTDAKVSNSEKDELETSKAIDADGKSSLSILAPPATPKLFSHLGASLSKSSNSEISSVSCSSTSIPSEVMIVDEETRMSAETNSRAQTPAKQVVTSSDIVEESQSSVHSTGTTESGKTPSRPSKAPRLEVQEPDTNVITADLLSEYYWKGNGPFMLQEQVAQFLGIKSFKRKYPGIMRRMLDMQERDYIREQGLASEHMCDLGLTAVNAADILDIMYTDFQDKYEEYCKHQRDRQAKELINKQKALSLAAAQDKCKADITEQAIHSAAQWNARFNKTRKETRKTCMDLQNLTVHYPKGKMVPPVPAPHPGNYPVALVPGQFAEFYQEFTPTELNNLPINTMCYNEVTFIPREESEDSSSDGSESDSDSSGSSSSSSDSDSSSGVEDCKLCKHSPKKVTPPTTVTPSSTAATIVK